MKAHTSGRHVQTTAIAGHMPTYQPTFLPTCLQCGRQLAALHCLRPTQSVFVLSTLLLTAARRRRCWRRRRIGSCTVYILRCAYATSAPCSTVASRRNARGARCRWLQSWPLTQTHRRTDCRRRRRRAGHILLHTSNPPCSSTSSRTEPAGYSNFAGGGLLNFQHSTTDCRQVPPCAPLPPSSLQAQACAFACASHVAHHPSSVQWRGAARPPPPPSYCGTARAATSSSQTLDCYITVLLLHITNSAALSFGDLR